MATCTCTAILFDKTIMREGGRDQQRKRGRIHVLVPFARIPIRGGQTWWLHFSPVEKNLQMGRGAAPAWQRTGRSLGAARAL
jgi:hypothetical protein